MSGWNGLPWDRPGLDDAQRRMWDLADEFDTAAAYRERAIREREQNMPAGTRELFAKLDEFWRKDLESRA